MKKYLYCIASVPFFSLEAIKNNPELTAAFVQMLTERRNSFQDTLRDSYPNLMALEDTSLVRLLLEAEFPIRVGGRLSSAWTWCEPVAAVAYHADIRARIKASHLLASSGEDIITDPRIRKAAEHVARMVYGHGLIKWYKKVYGVRTPNTCARLLVLLSYDITHKFCTP